MHVHFIIHESFEAPGAYEAWAQSHNHTITYSRMYQGDTLPEHVEYIDFLIVMGGPQSPDTRKKECPYFDSKAEQAVILSAIKAGKVVLGICLGAQLLGEALGAKCSHSPEKEIGKFPITLTDAGLNNNLFSHFGSVLDVGHWHSDMPGMTENAQIIAYSEGCPRQIIAYDILVYGFQCHMEFTPKIIDLLIENSQKDMEKADLFRFVESSSALRSHSFEEMNEKLFVFLDKICDIYLSQNKIFI